ncbi:MAG: thiol-activated cytolysin family protein [Bacteroidota bacterium]
MRYPLFILLVVPLLFLAGCKKRGTDGFLLCIENGGNVGFETRNEEAITSSTTTTEIIDGQEWECETFTVSLTDGLGSAIGGFPSFNPNSEVVFPGALLQGNSLDQATPNIIPLPRGSGDLSIDLVDTQDPSESVTVMELNQVRDAIAAIVNRTDDTNIPARLDLKVQEIHSNQQLALEMGMTFETFLNEFSGSFDISTSEDRSSFLIQLNQTYYTMNYTIPTDPAEFFAEDVKPSDLEEFIGPGNPGTFISAVTYGRYYYMLLESKSSSLATSAEVNAKFSDGIKGGSVNVTMDYLESLEEVNIRVKAYGGDAVSTLQNFNETNLDNVATFLAKSTSIKNALPISYVVRNLDDRQIVAVKLATEYDVRNCLPTSETQLPGIVAHWAGVVDLLGGPVGAAGNIGAPGERRIAFFNTDGDEYILSENDQLSGPFPIDNLAPNGATEFPFDAIGACGMYKEMGNYLGQFYFNPTGTQQVAYINANNDLVLQEDVTEWANGGGAFAADGYGAFCNWERNPSVTNTGHAVFNRTGSQYIIYQTDLNEWTTPVDTEDYEGSNPLKEVSAAAFFEFGDERFHVFIDKEGTSFTLWRKGGTIEGFSPVYPLTN